MRSKIIGKPQVAASEPVPEVGEPVLGAGGDDMLRTIALDVGLGSHIGGSPSRLLRVGSRSLEPFSGTI